MLVEVCHKNGVFVNVSENSNCCSVVEAFFVGDLFCVMFEDECFVVDSVVGGKSLVFGGLEFELVKFA